MISIVAGIGILATIAFGAAISSALAQTNMSNTTMSGNATGGNTTAASGQTSEL
jgi:hypothetical protein